MVCHMHILYQVFPNGILTNLASSLIGFKWTVKTYLWPYSHLRTKLNTYTNSPKITFMTSPWSALQSCYCILLLVVIWAQFKTTFLCLWITCTIHPFCWRCHNAITLTSQWPRWRLQSPASRWFTHSFRRRSKKTSKLRVTGLCAGNSPGPVNSPHKGPVTRKMFSFDDVIMALKINETSTGFWWTLSYNCYIMCQKLIIVCYIELQLWVTRGKT